MIEQTKLTNLTLFRGIIQIILSIDFLFHYLLEIINKSTLRLKTICPIIFVNYYSTMFISIHLLIMMTIVK